MANDAAAKGDLFDFGAVGIRADKIRPSSGVGVDMGVGEAIAVSFNEITVWTHITMVSGCNVTVPLQAITATGVGTVTASGTQVCGIITTAAQTAAAGASVTITLTDPNINAADAVFASVTTTGTGTPCITKVTPADGSVVIVVQNVHASAAFNAALRVSFFTFTA